MKMIIEVVLISVVCAFTAASAETKDANISFKGSSTYLRVEQDLFDNPFGGQLRTIPPKFDGKKINRLEMKPREGAKRDAYDPVQVPVHFKVTKAGNVYIISDSRVSGSFVKDGWAVVDEGKWGWINEGYWDEKRNRVRGYHILTKHLDTGEYTLPASQGVGTRVIDM